MCTNTLRMMAKGGIFDHVSRSGIMSDFFSHKSGAELSFFDPQGLCTLLDRRPLARPALREDALRPGPADGGLQPGLQVDGAHGHSNNFFLMILMYSISYIRTVYPTTTQPPTVVCKMEAQSFHTLFAHSAPTSMLNWHSLTKFLHGSSVESLLRVRYWLGTRVYKFFFQSDQGQGIRYRGGTHSGIRHEGS